VIPLKLFGHEEFVEEEKFTEEKFFKNYE